MDDRRRKQIPWNAVHYFPGKCGRSKYIEGNCKGIDLKNSMIAGLRLREWQISIT